MIVRTCIAYCDEESCDVTEEINPEHTQPFRLLREAGWSLVSTKDDIETYCPNHPRQEWDSEGAT